jgi:superfamily I DNA/RNA helicase
MKRAQLLGLRIPGTLLLVDESQDMDGCQVNWSAKQQVVFGTHIYVVGDAAQTLFTFRGA